MSQYDAQDAINPATQRAVHRADAGASHHERNALGQNLDHQRETGGVSPYWDLVTFFGDIGPITLQVLRSA